jgi:transcriptional regulator with XRE-family HTH domain
MSTFRITGNQLRAARALCGLTMSELADRARLTTRCLSKWENSSNAVPAANYGHLCRAVDALEAEGVTFTRSGVDHVRPSPVTPTTLHSEAVA